MLAGSINGRTAAGTGDGGNADPFCLLASLLRGCGPGLRLVEHLEHGGDVVFRHACKLGLEGIVSKRKGSPYDDLACHRCQKLLYLDMLASGHSVPGHGRSSTAEPPSRSVSYPDPPAFSALTRKLEQK